MRFCKSKKAARQRPASHFSIVLEAVIAADALRIWLGSSHTLIASVHGIKRVMRSEAIPAHIRNFGAPPMQIVQDCV